MANDTFSSRIDEKLQKQIKRYCIDRGIKIQTFIEQAVICFFEKEGRYGKKSTK